MRFLLLLAPLITVSTARAERADAPQDPKPAARTNLTTKAADPRPETQPLSCQFDAEECNLVLEGKLIGSRSDRSGKWHDLQIATTQNGKRLVVFASINRPRSKKYKLKTGVRYRFTIAARKPFAWHSLWVLEAEKK